MACRPLQTRHAVDDTGNVETKVKTGSFCNGDAQSTEQVVPLFLILVCFNTFDTVVAEECFEAIGNIHK